MKTFRIGSIFILMFFTHQMAVSMPEQLKGLDELIESEMERWNIPGLSVAIVNDGEIVLTKGYGVKELGKPDKVDAFTQFGIASNSKAFNCAALAILVDEGKIEWDDLVIEHIPHFRLADTERAFELTILDLVTHQAGVEGANRAWWLSQFTREEMMDRLQYLKTVAPIRTGYRYNNLMYFVSGMVVETVTNQTWDEFVRERIFEPLEMEDSSTSTNDLEKFGNYATPHALNDDFEMVPTKWYNSDHIAPAASVNSCANDLAHWMQMLMNHGEWNGNQIISEEQIEEMQSPHSIISADYFNETLGRNVVMKAYGLGHRIYDYKGHKYVEHGGHLVTFRSTVCMVPEKGIGVVVLTSSETDFCSALAYEICDMLLEQDNPDWIDIYWKRHEEGLEDAKEDAKELQESQIKETKPTLSLEAYAGVYANPLYGKIDISWDDEKLTHVFNDTPYFKGEIKHWHYDTFLLDPFLDFRGKELIQFVFNTEGKVDKVIISDTEYMKEGEAE